jgi:Sap, sulfolipid-1-addressing protein
VDVAAVLPLAFVMIAGPQIISAFFFATSEDWRRSSAAYVVGAALSVTAVATAAYLIAKGTEIGGGEDSDSGNDALDYAIVGLLVFAMAYVYRGRNQSEPPKWMGKLQAATPKTSFVLGFLLLGLFPSDLITSVTVGSHLANDGDPWWQILPFVFLTALLLALPALLVAMLGHRAREFLPKVRDWMNMNSWIVSEAVIVLFIAIVLSG